MAFAPDGRLFVAEQGGTAARHQERRAAARRRSSTLDGQRDAASAACSASPSTPTSPSTTSSTSTTRRPPPPVHNRISRFTASRRRRRAGQRGRDPRPRQPRAAPPTTTAAPSTSAPTASSTSPSATTRTATTRSRSTTGSGKMLRINADGTIPTDNPFFGTADGREPRDLGAGPAQPVHLRLPAAAPAGCSSTTSARTPGRRSTTASPASNYGWPDTEGPTTDPALPHARSTPTRTRRRRRAARSPAARSTTRRPRSSRPSYVGDYFFADFCGGWIQRLDLATRHGHAASPPAISAPVDLKVGDDGSLYYLLRAADGNARLRRVRYVGAGVAPAIITQPQTRPSPWASPRPSP